MSGLSSHDSQGSHGSAGHETVDVTFKYAIWLIPVCMILLVVYVAVCWFGATASLTREMARKQTMGAEAGAAPLKEFRDHEDSSMHQYGMKEDGKVSMPIDHAMEMMAKEAGSSADSMKAK